MRGRRAKVVPEVGSPSMPYIIRQNNHDLSNIVRNDETRRTLGSLAISGSRPYVWPLYTPSGISVLDNAPADHPFHNGVFVAQAPAEPSGANFWATPCHERLPG